MGAVSSSLHKGHRYPGEIISHCVWLYHRFPLSLREVEEMMLAVADHTQGIGGPGAGAMTTTGGRSRSLMFLRFPARLSHYGGHGRCCLVSSSCPSHRACGSPEHGLPTPFTANIRSFPPEQRVDDTILRTAEREDQNPEHRTTGVDPSHFPTVTGLSHHANP
jgi:hypothetical protein